MFPEVRISGSPYERGRQYGAAVAPQVRHSIASYARLFAHRRGLDWQAAQGEALRYEGLLRELAPDLLEEIRGIADGAGEPFAAILALNVRTELMAGIGIGMAHPDGPAARARNRERGVPQHADEPTPATTAVGGQPIDDGECTTAAAQPIATATGTTLLAQTWDWQGDQRAACILLHIHAPGEPTILTLTEAGMVAKIGINSAGVAVGLNLLRSQTDGREVGMPVHILLRQMLQAPTFAAARALADRVVSGGSSCVTLASANGELVSLELTPAGWPRCGRRMVCWHTRITVSMHRQRLMNAHTSRSPRRMSATTGRSCCCGRHTVQSMWLTCKRFCVIAKMRPAASAGRRTSTCHRWIAAKVSVAW